MFEPCVIICNPKGGSAPSCIIFPPNANNFNFNPGMIALLPRFHGLEYENPYLYIKEFEEVCATCLDQTCSEETGRLEVCIFL